MAYRLLGDRPLSEPMLKIDPRGENLDEKLLNEYIAIPIHENEFDIFWTMSSIIGRHFVLTFLW